MTSAELAPLTQVGFARRAVLLNVNEPETRGVALALQTVLDDLGKGLGPLLVSLMVSAWGACVLVPPSWCPWDACMQRTSSSNWGAWSSDTGIVPVPCFLVVLSNDASSNNQEPLADWLKGKAAMFEDARLEGWVFTAAGKLLSTWPLPAGYRAGPSLLSAHCSWQRRRMGCRHVTLHLPCSESGECHYWRWCTLQPS